MLIHTHGTKVGTLGMQLNCNTKFKRLILCHSRLLSLWHLNGSLPAGTINNSSNLTAITNSQRVELCHTKLLGLWHQHKSCMRNEAAVSEKMKKMHRKLIQSACSSFSFVRLPARAEQTWRSLPSSQIWCTVATLFSEHWLELHIFNRPAFLTVKLMF